MGGSLCKPRPPARRPADRRKIKALQTKVKKMEGHLALMAHSKWKSPDEASLSHLSDDSQELVEHHQLRLTPGGARLPKVPPIVPRVPDVDCATWEYTIEAVSPAVLVRSSNEDVVLVAMEMCDLLWRVVVSEVAGGKRVGSGVSGVLSQHSLRDPEIGTVPIVDDGGSVVALFNTGRTIVAPFRHPDNTVTRIQRLTVKGAHIGHRGGGAGYDPTTFTVENTMASFLAAAKRGASYIEFDVQLTADGVPVVAHDLSMNMVKVSNKGEPLPRAIGPWKTPVRSLTAAQLADMRPAGPELHNKDQGFLTALLGRPELKRSASASNITVPKGGKGKGKGKVSDRVAITDKFPTLVEVLEKTPESVGFDVEIKYPEYEAEVLAYNYPTRNEIVDATLKAVFDVGGKRAVFFSSFDPEVCVLLQLKQHRYPVFFLTSGGKKTDSLDPRTASLEAAVEFASQFHLDGIVTESTPVLAKPQIVKEITDKGLSLFTYGRKNNNKKNVKKQLAAGVHAIISDRVTARPKPDGPTTPPLERQPTRVCIVMDHDAAGPETTDA